MAIPVAALFKAARDGLPKLHAAATIICTTVRWSRPIIARKYPTNTALQAAMDAAMAACQTLRLGIEEQKDVDRAASVPNAPITPPVPPAPEPPPETP